MEGNGLSGGLFPGVGSGMLGLEMPLHPQHPQQQQNPPNPHHLHQHPQMLAFSMAHHEADHNPQNQQSVKHNFPYATKPKQHQQQQQLVLSDEDEHVGEDGDGKRQVSPWHRMKWTDGMVRLLIMAVFYIGDDQAGSEGTADAAGKKKAGAVLQKKGKWKSVSRAMMEKGFYVSPQQCEDKFNDLNKRYKRVNDILGKGTACRVVENQSLLDSMDNLSPKMKEEVRKLLNSKHLFFKEMCAYHNSCGGGGSGFVGTHQSQETAAGPTHHYHHSPDNCALAPNSGKTETEGSKMVKGGSGEEEDDDNEDDYGDEDYEDEDDDDEENVAEGGGVRPHNGHPHKEENDDERSSSRKRQRKVAPPPQSPLIQQLSSELMTVMQDGSKNPWEKKQWMKTQLMKLEEERLSYQWEAFELEKQRFKWVKFSSKKEREMERAKLKNEQTKIENERMVLLLHQKELDLIQLHHLQQQQSSN